MEEKQKVTLETLLVESISALAKYIESRRNSKKFALRDLIRTNIHDPNSMARRVSTADTVITQLSACSTSISNPSTVVETYRLLCNSAESIKDPSSTLRKRLMTMADTYFKLATQRVKDPTLERQLAIRHRENFNHRLAHQLDDFDQTGLRGVAPTPTIIGRRVRDFFFPKKRDDANRDLLDLATLLRQCQTTQDYQQVITEIDKIKQKPSVKGSEFSEVLTSVREQLSSQVLSSDPVVQTETNGSPRPSKELNSELAREKDKIKYAGFQFKELFKSSVEGSGLARAGKVKREEGLIGALGLRIAVFNPQLPGTSVVTAVIGGGMHMLDAFRKSEVEKTVAEEIPAEVVLRVAELLAEKFTHRYAHQIGELYYSSLYTNEVDKFVRQAVDNMLKHLKENITISLPAEQAQLYQTLLAAKKPLSAEQLHQFTELQAEIIANSVIQGAYKKATSLPFAGLFPGTHLMTVHDTNARFGGQRFNIYSIYNQHGFVVVDDDKSLKFYSANGLKPEKYGYIFITKAELESMHYLKPMTVEPDVQQYYQVLHQRYKPTRGLPQPAAATVAVENVVSPTHAQALADQLKNIYQEVLKNKAPEQKQVAEWRKELNKINKEMQRGQLENEDIKIRADRDSMPLSSLYKEVNRAVKPHEKEQLTGLLTPAISRDSQIHVSRRAPAVDDALHSRHMRTQ